MRFIKTLKNLFGLPAGYTRIEYLASDGNQYIDTEYVMSDGKTMSFESDMMWTANKGTANFFYGYRSVNSATVAGDMRAFFIYGTDTNPSGRLAIRYGVDAENSTQTAVSLNNQYKMTFDGTNLKVNGTTYATHSQAYNPANYQSMWLFNCNATGYYSTDISHFAGRIYRFKIFEDGVMVRDFVPCLDIFGNPCMYDLIERKAHYNKGTGEFTYGRQIIPVKYLQSTGNQYIDTGIKFDGANTKLEVKTYEDSLTRQHSICGDDGNYFYYFRGTGNWAVGYNGVASNIDSYISVGDNVFVIDKNNVYVNGVLAKTYTASSTVSSYNTLLFNRKTSLVDKGAVTIYYCKMWNNDVLVRDYIPAKDENGIGFLFDQVNNSVYLNAGSDAFITGDNVYQPLLRFIVDNDRVVPAEFKEVEYLESDSTAYIDTGVSGANNNLKIEMGFSYSKFTAYGYFFSNYESETANVTRFCLNGTDTDYGLTYINTRSQNGAIYTKNFTKNTFHTFVLTKTSVSIDGNITTNDNPPVGTENTKNIILFNRGAGTYYEKRDVGMRCYYFRIYDNDVLVRDFIPCLDANDILCMYDRVEGKPYYNLGTGEFSYGKQIIPVEYLYTGDDIDCMSSSPYTSTSYRLIDTKETIDLTSVVEIKFAFDKNIYYSGCGLRNNSSNMTQSVYFPACYGTQDKFGWTIGLNEEQRQKFNLDTNEHTITVDLPNSNVVWDNVNYPIANLTYTPSERTFPLFAFSDSRATEENGYRFPMQGKIYYAKFWKNGVLTKDFIPCKDENDIGYMFDRVTHTLYENKGTGSFITGNTKKELTFRLPKDPIPREYQMVSYLESSGTQYINTGFVPTSDNFQFEIRMLSQNTSAYIGYRSVNSGTATGDMRWFFNYSDGRVAIRYGDTTENSTLSFDTQTTHKFYFNGSSLYVDDVNYLTTTKKYATPVYKSFYLFSVNTSGYYSADIANFVGRIYYTKIWDNGILVRNFVPVLRKSDSVAGMYDIVTKQFFENAGTGTFNYG